MFTLLITLVIYWCFCFHFFTVSSHCGFFICAGLFFVHEFTHTHINQRGDQSGPDVPGVAVTVCHICCSIRRAVPSDGGLVFGNVPGAPSILIDGRAHVVQDSCCRISSCTREPAASSVARRLPSVRLSARAQLVGDLQPSGNVIARPGDRAPSYSSGDPGDRGRFARSALQRYERVHDAIVRIMNGELELRFAGHQRGPRHRQSGARGQSRCSTRSRACFSSSRAQATTLPMDPRTPLAVACARNLSAR